MPMDAVRETRLRNAVARLINEGLRTGPASDGDVVGPEELFIWEIVKTVRNDTITQVCSTVGNLRENQQ